MADMNININDSKSPGYHALIELMNIFDLTNLIKNNICITGTHKSLIDIILTNKRKCQKKSSTFALRVSVFHKMPITILQAQVACLKPKEISFRSYKILMKTNF